MPALQSEICVHLRSSVVKRFVVPQPYQGNRRHECLRYKLWIVAHAFMRGSFGNQTIMVFNLFIAINACYT